MTVVANRLRIRIRSVMKLLCLSTYLSRMSLTMSPSVCGIERLATTDPYKGS